MSDADEVEKWYKLFVSGAITEEEFAAKKRQILGISASSGNETEHAIEPKIGSLLVRLVSDLDKLINQYGPFRVLDATEAQEVDEGLVWTQVEGSEYVGIKQGYFENDSDMYYLAAHACSDDHGVITTDAFFECEFCDDNDEDCPECEGSRLIFIDIEAIVLEKKIDFESPEAIWSQRSPG